MTHRFHGLSLAANSTFDNAHFERLVADPLPIAPGRIWFNTTEKAFKYSSLDAGGAVTIHVFADAASLAISVATMQQSLTDEISARTSADTTELNARVAAINAVQTALATEVADRTNADAAESQARIDGIAAEAAARTTAIGVASATAANATASERDARLAGDASQTARSNNIQDELDVSQAGAGLNVDGTYTAPENTVHLGAALSLKAADVLLDAAIASEVATRIGQVAGLTSALANEKQLREDGDANLLTQIEAWTTAQLEGNANADLVEQAARIAKDSALQAELDQTQATIGTDTDGKLIPITGTHFLNSVTTVFGGAFVLDTEVYNAQQSIVAEGLARATADSNFHDQLQQEVTDRATADSAIQTELNTTQAGAGLQADGSYLHATDSNYLNAATTLKDADHKLDAAIHAVSDRVGNIETVAIPNLQDQITAEVTRATDAESAESAARTAAVATLNAAVAQEVSNRTTAVSTVTTAVTTEVTRATNAEGGLQSQINAIVAASGEGAAALKGELNTGRFTFKSTAPALVHVINHGLNTEFYSLNIMVKGLDGVWRNDIMPVEDIDVNSFRVTLSESCDIKASGQSNAALA